MDKLFGNKAERAEEACELYKQAATNYKLAKKCTKISYIFLLLFKKEKKTKKI